MPLRYNGSGLVPAPLIQASKTYIRDEGGRILRPEYTFNLQGTIVNVGTSLDSPGAQGSDNLTAIINEQNRIRQIFAQDGKTLEIEDPFNPSGLFRAYCRVNSIDFSPSVWVNRCDYTIGLTAVAVSGLEEPMSELDSASERWSISELEDGTYTVGHELSAKGTLIYSASGMNNPLLVAKNWCKDRRITNNDGYISSTNGISPALNTILSTINNASGNYWNYSAVENIGSSDYTWNLSETMIHNPSGNCRETYVASVSYSENDTRFADVTVNGTVYGYAGYASNLDTRNSRAKAYYESSVRPYIYTRLANYVPSGYTINPAPRTKQETYELTAGIVTYTITYPMASGAMISGAIQEDIQINDKGKTDIFASIVVPGRQNGPIIQAMNTYTSPERTVNIAAKLASSTTPLSISNIRSVYLSKPNTDAIMQALCPQVGRYYCSNDSEDFSVISRQYNRTVTWVAYPAGSGISGTQNIIHSLV